MERSVFLERVAAATKASFLPDAEPDNRGGLVPEPPAGDLVELFIERLEAVNGVAHRTTPRDAPQLVLKLARAHNADSVLSWDEGELPTAGVLRHLVSNGLTWVDAQVPSDPDGRLQHQRPYHSVQLGLTGGEAGLAESGSIVLSSGPGKPRMASAIPAVHVALLPTAAILPSLSHYLGANPQAAAAYSNLIVVTGPSRTGDIESRLTLGVHGPKHLHVVIVE